MNQVTPELGREDVVCRRMLCLGDSYTVGQGVEPSESWPAQWARRRRKSTGIETAITTVARTGWTSHQLLEAWVSEKRSNEYDVATVLIGVNDQFDGQPIEEYVIAFERIMECAERATQGSNEKFPVMVLSIPDWSISPYARNVARESGRDLRRVAREIDSFNQMNYQIALAHRSCYVDISDLSRRCTGLEMFTNDGLHPSVQQYALWIEAIHTVVDRG